MSDVKAMYVCLKCKSALAWCQCASKKGEQEADKSSVELEAIGLLRDTYDSNRRCIKEGTTPDMMPLLRIRAFLEGT